MTEASWHPDHDPNKCPKCGGDDVWQDSADVGVGIIYGPRGCPSCGWSEDERYDMSEGRSGTNTDPDDKRWTDQFGNSYNKDRVREDLQRFGLNTDPFE